MKRTIIQAVMRSLAIGLMFLTSTHGLHAQPPTKLVGTITSISGSTITIKSDAGEEHTITVSADTVLKQVAPGQKDLSTAEAIHLSDLTTGDRVLAKLDSSSPSAQALQIIAIKQSDLADKHQREQEAWQRNGVAGLVKSVDAKSGVIILSSGIGSAAKTITIHTSPTTVLKRYAPASVSYDQATIATINTIQVGDQLRARGTKSADESELAALEVVSGSFLNISGVIQSLDATASTITLKDLATKKQLTIHLPAETQMRQLPEQMAQMLATRLKSGSAEGSGGNPSGAWAGHGPGSGDPQRLLNRAPVIHFSDLKKGEAILLVATDGGLTITGVTLLAGVEPLLEAPAASKSLLSNWTLNSGGSELGAQ